MLNVYDVILLIAVGMMGFGIAVQKQNKIAIIGYILVVSAFVVIVIRKFAVMTAIQIAVAAAVCIGLGLALRVVFRIKAAIIRKKESQKNLLDGFDKRN